jgi:uncharacterized membrane protein YtjA (UPF0391 family)
MIQLAILLFLAALVAGFLGFAGGAGSSGLPAQVAFFVLLGLAVLSFLVALIRKWALRG